MGRAVGQTLKEFKKSTKELIDDDDKTEKIAKVEEDKEKKSLNKMYIVIRFNILVNELYLRQYGLH